MGRVGNMFQIARTFGARDGMLRLEYELQRGSGLMSRRMRAVHGWESWELSRITSNTSAGDILDSRLKGDPPFFFSDSRSVAAELKKVLGASGKEFAVAEANKILDGKLPYFGRLSFDCGFPPQWFRNPVTGQTVQRDRSWTKMRFASEEHGDLKFILEPSRFLFVYPLARAYAISGDERFADAFWSSIEDWATNNPPMSGPLWICGQESSLRIMAWTFALHAFIASRSTTARRTALLVSMIAAHAWRTTQTLGYARSQRSNHLISEAVGLWTAGTLFPELNDALGWQKLGAKILREAVLDQITPEGVFLQNSFNYERMVLQQLLWVIRLAEISKTQLDSQIRERTAAGFGFISQFVDESSGQMPNYGSNDGSHILPLATCDYSDFRPLLRMGECVLNRCTALPPGRWDEAALWIGGRIEPPTTREPSHQPKPANSATGSSSSLTGYHRLGTDKSWALVRAGNYTRRPFQADQLHVDLWWHGLNLARDAGTYLYNGGPPWDNGLAGTRVHNTVMVDDHDQMQRAGRFLWLNWAQASGRSFCSTLGGGLPQPNAEFLDTFEGEHDGYRRLGVTHRRLVRCVAENAWVIVDDLLGGGEHELGLHWLLPDLPLEVTSALPFTAILSAEEERIHWNIFSGSGARTAVVRAGKVSGKEVRNGDKADLLGWKSPTYGELRPAISLLHQVRAPLPVRIVTVILAGDEFQLWQDGRSLTVSRGATQVYQLNMRSTE
jgi:hypothetical protein